MPLVALPLLLFAANACAAPEDENKVQLEYVRKPGTAEPCPEEPVVRHAIITEMKEDPFSPTAKAKVRVIIERKGGLFHARYEIIDSTGKLVLPMKFSPYDECAIAIEHVGFSLSVHLPRLITGRTPKPEERKPPPDPSRSSPTESRWSFRPQLDVGVLGSIGTVPKDVTLGFSVHGAARWSSYSVSLGGRFELPRSDGTDTNRIGAWRFLIEAVPCVHYHGFVGCGLLQIGALVTTVQEQQFFETFPVPNAAIGVRFGGEWFLGRPFPVNHVALYVSADLAAPIVRQDIHLRSGGGWLASFPTGAISGGVRYLF